MHLPLPEMLGFLFNLIQINQKFDECRRRVRDIFILKHVKSNYEKTITQSDGCLLFLSKLC